MFQSSLALNANALRRNYRRLSFQQLKRLTEGRTRIYMYAAKARPEADSLSPADQLGSQLSGGRPPGTSTFFLLVSCLLLACKLHKILPYKKHIRVH